MRKVFRQEPWLIILLVAVEVFLIVAFIVIYNRGDLNYNSGSIYLVLDVLLAVAIVNALKTKIIVDDVALTHQTLYKTRSVQWSEIKKVETAARIRGGGPHGIHGTYEMTIYSQTGKMIIAIKPFSRKNLAELAGIIMMKCQSAVIDDQTRMMMEGKMPSLFFKSQ